MITQPGPLPPPSAETLKVWKVPLVGDAGYHFQLILNSNHRQLKWSLSCNSPSFESRSELIQNRQSDKLEPSPHLGGVFILQTAIIPNEFGAANFFRSTEGKSEEDKLTELKMLLETLSGVPLFAKRFIAPEVTNGMKEVTYVVARLLSDGAARIAPTDANKLLRSVDCQDLIERHIYTEPYIDNGSFEPSQAD